MATTPATVDLTLFPIDWTDHGDNIQMLGLLPQPDYFGDSAKPLTLVDVLNAERPRRVWVSIPFPHDFYVCVDPRPDVPTLTPDAMLAYVQKSLRNVQCEIVERFPHYIYQEKPSQWAHISSTSKSAIRDVVEKMRQRTFFQKGAFFVAEEFDNTYMPQYLKLLCSKGHHNFSLFGQWLRVTGAVSTAERGYDPKNPMRCIAALYTVSSPDCVRRMSDEECAAEGLSQTAMNTVLSFDIENTSLSASVPSPTCGIHTGNIITHIGLVYSVYNDHTGKRIYARSFSIVNRNGYGEKLADRQLRAVAPFTRKFASIPSGDGDKEHDIIVTYVESVPEVLAAMCEIVSILDPDTLTGFNIVGYDLQFLAAQMHAHGGTALSLRHADSDILTQAKSMASNPVLQERTYSHSEISYLLACVDMGRLLRTRHAQILTSSAIQDKTVHFSIPGRWIVDMMPATAGLLGNKRHISLNVAAQHLKIKTAEKLPMSFDIHKEVYRCGSVTRRIVDGVSDLLWNHRCAEATRTCKSKLDAVECNLRSSVNRTAAAKVLEMKHQVASDADIARFVAEARMEHESEMGAELECARAAYKEALDAETADKARIAKIMDDSKSAVKATHAIIDLITEYCNGDCWMNLELYEKADINISLQQCGRLMYVRPANRHFLNASQKVLPSAIVYAKYKGLVCVGIPDVVRELSVKIDGATTNATPGVYVDVVELDVASLYPSSMWRGNICPSTLVITKDRESVGYDNMSWFMLKYQGPHGDSTRRDPDAAAAHAPHAAAAADSGEDDNDDDNEEDENSYSDTGSDDSDNIETAERGDNVEITKHPEGDANYNYMAVDVPPDVVFREPKPAFDPVEELAKRDNRAATFVKESVRQGFCTALIAEIFPIRKRYKDDAKKPEYAGTIMEALLTAASEVLKLLLNSLYGLLGILLKVVRKMLDSKHPLSLRVVAPPMSVTCAPAGAAVTCLGRLTVETMAWCTNAWCTTDTATGTALKAMCVLMDTDSNYVTAPCAGSNPKSRKEIAVALQKFINAQLPQRIRVDVGKCMRTMLVYVRKRYTVLADDGLAPNGKYVEKGVDSAKRDNVVWLCRLLQTLDITLHREVRKLFDKHPHLLQNGRFPLDMTLHIMYPKIIELMLTHIWRLYALPKTDHKGDARMLDTEARVLEQSKKDPSQSHVWDLPYIPLRDLTMCNKYNGNTMTTFTRMMAAAGTCIERGNSINWIATRRVGIHPVVCEDPAKWCCYNIEIPKLQASAGDPQQSCDILVEWLMSRRSGACPPDMCEEDSQRLEAYLLSLSKMNVVVEVASTDASNIISSKTKKSRVSRQCGSSKDDEKRDERKFRLVQDYCIERNLGANALDMTFYERKIALKLESFVDKFFGWALREQARKREAEQSAVAKKSDPTDSVCCKTTVRRALEDLETKMCDSVDSSVTLSHVLTDTPKPCCMAAIETACEALRDAQARSSNPGSWIPQVRQVMFPKGRAMTLPSRCTDTVNLAREYMQLLGDYDKLVAHVKALGTECVKSEGGNMVPSRTRSFVYRDAYDGKNILRSNHSIREFMQKVTNRA